MIRSMVHNIFVLVLCSNFISSRQDCIIIIISMGFFFIFFLEKTENYKNESLVNSHKHFSILAVLIPSLHPIFDQLNNDLLLFILHDLFKK